MLRVVAALLGLLISVQPTLAETKAHTFFNRVDRFLLEYVREGLVNYEAIKENPEPLREIIEMLKNFDVAQLSDDGEKAFWIDAYNVLVIDAVVQHYPIDSPMDVGGFFDRRKHKVAEEALTLNDIENIKLRKRFGDARIHFALVCAAQSCPPLVPRAYTPANVDSLLEARTRANLNDPQFIRVDPEARTVRISEIFKWYREDFVTEDQGVLDYINRYRDDKIPESYEVDYYTYDWNLNEYWEIDTGVLLRRRDTLQAYTPSTLLRPGEIAIKQFNNLYTQTAFFNAYGKKVDDNRRSTFFTSITNVLYGLSRDVNVGFDLYVKSVRFDAVSSSPLDVFEFASSENARTALTSFAPKVKFSPLARLRSFSVQTLFLIPVGSMLEAQPFLDFDEVQWWTQLFYDHMLSEQFLLYLESGYYFRFGEDASFSTPTKAILNYYPSDRWIFYLATELAPAWDGLSWGSYFFQAGPGVKYQFAANLELEVLFTQFLMGKDNGAGVTYNLGFRWLR